MPRHVITHTLSHRRETLDLLISHVTSVVKSHRESHQLLSFFAAVIVESISLMCDAARSPANTGVTEESVLQKALPVLEETFRARKTPEFQIGGYMLATVVVSKIPMKDEVLLALMGGIVGGWSEESVTPALACLALIAQARTCENAGRLPDTITARLLAIEDVVDRLQEMGKKYRVDSLVVGLSNGILDKMGKTCGHKQLGYVIRFLESPTMGPKGRKNVLKHLVSAAQTLQGFEEKPEDEELVRDALATSLVKWSEQGTKKVGKSLQIVFEENKVDVEMLELALRTVIRRPALPAASTPMSIEAPVKEAVTLEQLLDTIPAVGETVSFLEPHKTENKALFEHLQQIFLLAIRKPEGIQTVLAHELFAGKKETDAFAISLLAKIWTLVTNPVIARAAAIKQAVKIIKANANAKIDYQALVPLALSSLADPAERVRREGTHLIIALLDVYKQLESDAVATKRKKPKGGEQLAYWGIDTIYGSGAETENLKVLDASDARKFLEVVVARGLQECILDSNYIVNVIENGLGSSKKDQQKESKLKSSVKTNVLSFLSSHAVNVPCLSVQLRLLTMLNRISNGPSSRTDFLLSALQEWMGRSLEENKKACEEERIDISEVEAQMVAVVEGQEGLTEFVSVLSTDVGGEGLVSAVAKRIIAIWGSLEQEAKANLASELLQISLQDTEQLYSGSVEAVGVLRSVKLPTEAFQLFLEEARADLKSSLGMGAAAQPKRRRVSAPGAVSADKEDRIAAAVRRITIVAEILEGQEPRNHSSVLATLFSILGDLGSVEFSGITYLQSLLLSCTRDIIKGYKVCFPLYIGGSLLIIHTGFWCRPQGF